jgi:hypothetical protein
MDERFHRVEQIEQWVQMLLGIFASHSMLPLEFKPAYSIGDLLLQHVKRAPLRGPSILHEVCHILRF